MGLVVGLRLVTLGADTPTWVGDSVGLYVDEGFKTLAPRNLVLFGQEQWNPADDYQGWLGESPLTQLTFYVAFYLFGVQIEAARAVTVIWFTLFLAAFVWAVRKDYGVGLICLGLLLLGLQSEMFFYSRVALLETPIIVGLYGILFLLRRRREHLSRSVLAVFLGGLLATTFLVKKSALVYFLPAAFGLILVSRTGRDLFRRTRSAPWIAGLSLLVTTVLCWSHIVDRLDSTPAAFIHGIGIHAILKEAPVLVVTGLISLFLIIRNQWRALLLDPYLAGLAALILLAPVLLAMISYRPLRYYVPILPAYILITLEWIHLRWRVGRFESRSQRAAGIVVAALLGFSIFQLVNRYILSFYALPIGSDSGISDSMLLTLGLPAAFAIALLLLYRRNFAFPRRQAATALIGMLVLAILGLGAVNVGTFLVNPQFVGRSIGAELDRRVPPGSSLAGDWAPFFTIETSLKALYMNRAINAPHRILELKPDYFLYSKSYDSRLSLREILSTPGVEVRDPIMSAEYAGSVIRLFPLVYAESGAYSSAVTEP